MKKAEILSIGSELTSGRNLDTNSQWLSLRLGEAGIPVGWHTTVADDFDDNVEALRVAARRATLVIATGGLGPTQDDLTREVLARLGGVELVIDEAVLAHIQSLFARRGRAMPERNRVQAYRPAGSEVLANPLGTAPGVWMRLGQSVIAALPGVPSEMHAMYLQEVLPRLRGLGLAGAVRVQRKINTFGAGESAVEQKLMDLTRRGHEPEVGITASDATISLRIFASGADEEAARRVAAPVERTIRERLGDLVFGVDDEELQDAVLALLGARRQSLATAEGVTGGLLAGRLAGRPGASAWFRGGVVAYDNRLKVELLGVPQRLLDEHGAVSGSVAEAMAAGCRVRLGTDLAVSTVGVAGPGGATEERPAGLVFVGLAWDGGTASRSANWAGTRAEVQSRTAKLALNCVRLHLTRQPGG